MKRALIITFFILVAGCVQKPPEREVISAAGAPKAIGPYSQAVRVGNTLYLSGQLGLDPQSGRFAEGGFEAQARQALVNQKAVLEEAGFSLADVVQCQVFLKNMDDYGTFNTVYQEFFKDRFPARAVLEVSRIPKDGLVEIMMVAMK